MPTSDEIREYVEQSLPVAVIDKPTRIQRGYGNENWRVPTDDGELLVKIARRNFGAEKLSAAALAYRRAADGGVPVPELLHLDLEGKAFGGRAVRVLRYLAGVHPSEVLINDEAVQRFFGSLGRTLARLHTVPCEAFSSRVGGSPSFDTWAGYVDYRVPQIEERTTAGGGIGSIDHVALLEQARRVAAEVSPVVQPRLVHRDLYLDNLLAGPDGTLVALLDFDLAEAWDPLADLVKLRWQVLPQFPGAEAAFLNGYAAEGLPPQFERRVWVAEVLELVNHAANAVDADSREFADSAVARLETVLDATPAG